MVEPGQFCGGGLEIGTDSGVIYGSEIDVLEELLLVCSDGGCMSDALLRKSIDVDGGW